MDFDIDYASLLTDACFKLGRKFPFFCTQLASNLGNLATKEIHDELLSNLDLILFERTPDSVSMDLTCSANQLGFEAPNSELASGDFFCKLERDMLPQREKSINIFAQVMDFLDIKSLVSVSHLVVAILDHVSSTNENQNLSTSMLDTFSNVFSTMPFQHDFSVKSDFDNLDKFEVIFNWDIEQFQENYSDLWDILKKIQLLKVEFLNSERTMHGLIIEISNVGIKFLGRAAKGKLIWYHEDEAGAISIGEPIQFSADSIGSCSLDVTFTILTMFGWFPLSLPPVCCNVAYEAGDFQISIDSLGPQTTLEYLARALVPFARIRELLLEEFSQSLSIDDDKNLKIKCHLQLPHINSFLLSILKMIINKSIRNQILFFQDFFNSLSKDLEVMWEKDEDCRSVT